MASDAQVIVVGAGPAGSTAACLLARAGLSVLLLEKRAFPRDKLCGGFLAARSLGLLEQLHGAETCQELYHASDDRFQIWHAGGLVVDRRLGDRMAFIQRLELDHFLVRQAQLAGARLVENVEALELVQGAVAGHSQVVLRLRDGREVRASHLVVADGAQSRLARQLQPRARSQGLAMEVQVPFAGEAVPRLDFGLFPWGYGWLFPKRGCVTVGVAQWGGRKEGCKTLLANYLRLLGLPEVPASGWVLPDRPLRRLCLGRVLFVGDAAGLCEPISGEGLYYALRSGERAALALLQSPDPQALDRAYLKGTAHIRGQMRASRLFRPIFYSKGLQAPLLRAFSHLPELDRVEWRDIFRVAARTLLGMNPRR